VALLLSYLTALPAEAAKPAARRRARA